MFQRLLVAIDGTETSDVTLSFAGALAQHSGAVVHVLYVNEYIVGSRGIPLHTNAEATELLTGAVDLLRAQGLRVTGSAPRASYRQVPQHIVASAADFSADAIVVGTRRRRRLGRLFSAHVREHTIRLTSLSVIAAPAPLDLPADGRLVMDEILDVERDRTRSLSAQ
jgi:nucleotide-binding universal stress UspA family protein